MENKTLPSIVVWSWATQISGDLELFQKLVKEKLPSVSIKVFDHDKGGPIDEASLEIWRKAEVAILSSSTVVQFCEIDTPNMKWVQLCSAGVDKLLEHVKKSGLRSLPYKVTRMADTYGTTMAEYVVAQIVSHERKFEAMREAQKLCHWGKEFMSYRRLSQLTIGIVGAGSIGEEVARCCKCFGMKTIGLVRQERPQEKRSKFIDVYRVGTDELPLLVAESDYICSILPNCSETIDYFKGDIFSNATKKPVFMNIGRGNCIQEDTIITSIRNGWLSGAIIDVTMPEPLPKESKLWSIPEVIITPHISGIVTEEMIFDTFYENWKKFVKNETLNHEVDITKSY